MDKFRVGLRALVPENASISQPSYSSGGSYVVARSPSGKRDSVSQSPFSPPQILIADIMSDPAWQWCARVNPKDRLKVKRNFCKQIISGGISHFKHHMAGTHNVVAQCSGSQVNPLPPYVKHRCLELINAVKANRIEKEMQDADVGYGDPYEEEGSKGEVVELEE
ncbi:hypothetical protein EJ110_NYTH55158 [Nymphaea thermarum]|nr:hypothetical protein EJ110_NYTH55158 [Nymphaea thermarum]